MTPLLLTLVLLAPATGPDVVVVCPESFRTALQPWVEYRQGQGHRVAVVSNAGTDEDVRRRVRQVAEAGSLRFVLLVGDGVTTQAESPAERIRCVPVHRASAEVTVAWGSEPHIGSDTWYADTDDDQTPEVAVGRLPVDTPEELSRLVARIVAYERSVDFGPWRRQMNFVAGTSGFGALTDAVLETAARYFLSQEIPASYLVTMTYSSWRSPFCPDPRLLEATTRQRLSEGCLFWVYLGHGQPFGLDAMPSPNGEYPLLTVADTARLDGGRRPPIALLLSCYTGAFDAVEDCLAEEMLRAEGGPIAVLAGSRMTMPYANAVWATELLRCCVKEPSPTLGEAVLRAKQALASEPSQKGQSRVMLDALARALSPAPAKLAAERQEHVLLYNLLGDPLLRLPRPQPVELTVASAEGSPAILEVQGHCAVEGPVEVELVVPRDRLTFTPPPRAKFPERAEELAGFQEVYRRANDTRLASASAAVVQGQFQARLTVPAGTNGPCFVRAFVEGRESFALGAVALSLPQLTVAGSSPTIDGGVEVGRKPGPSGTAR